MPADADATGACVGAAATLCWGDRLAEALAKADGGADKASCGHQPRVMRQLPARSGDAGGYQWQETGTTDAARNPNHDSQARLM